MAVLYRECYDIYVGKKCIAKAVSKRYVWDLINIAESKYGEHPYEGPANDFEVTLKLQLVKVEEDKSDD